MGRFKGFLAALWPASFTVIGSEFISIVSTEAKRPSIYIKNAFITVYWRFYIFFIVGALAIAITCPYNNPVLVEVYLGSSEGGGTAAGSPYVIAMTNIGIRTLPHIVNALLLTSIFSAGNTYIYCATRTLHDPAPKGRAPRFLSYANKDGIPLYALSLSFLQVSNGSAKVLGWLVTVITGGGLINYILIGVTFLNYHAACKAQSVDRSTRPYYGRFEPYGAWIALVIQVVILLCYGYTAFSPFSVDSFFANYTMQLLAIRTFCGWKLFKKTKYIRPHEVNLVWERPRIDEYEATCTDIPIGFWTEMAQMFGLRRNKGQSSA
ncbi:hypothetical protein ACHAPJ_010601 [Fusarium lateritium]